MLVHEGIDQPLHPETGLGFTGWNQHPVYEPLELWVVLYRIDDATHDGEFSSFSSTISRNLAARPVQEF